MLLEKTKQMAILGIMAALSTILAVLGTVISVNTVFFTAAAAFFAGVAVVQYGTASATLFFLVCSALDFFINPNKFHVLLYVVFAGYLLLAEASYRWFQRREKKEWLHRIVRFFLFLLFYVPVVWLLPELFVADTVLERWMTAFWFLPALFGLAVPLWLLYDLAYATMKKELLKILRTANRSNG